MKTQLMILSIGIVLMLSACGGDDGGPAAPSAPPPPPAPVTSVIQEGSGTIREGFFVVLPFRTGTRGNLQATVDWTLRKNTVWVFLAKGNCTPRKFNAGRCDLRVRSQVVNRVEKPRRLSWPNAPRGQYTLLILNFGPRDDTFTVEVLLITTSGASTVTLIGSEVGAIKPQD
jgi:hypothetical protein